MEKINFSEKLKRVFPERVVRFSWKRIWIATLVFFVVLGIIFVSTIAYAEAYRDKVLPGVYIGEVPIGGLDGRELKEYFEIMNDKLASEGIGILYEADEADGEFTIFPVVATDDVVALLLSSDVDKEVARLLSYGKEGGFIMNLFSTLQSRIESPHLTLQHVTVDAERILDEVVSELANYENEAHDASVKIISVAPLKYEITTSSVGYGFEYSDVPGEIWRQWSALKMPRVKLVQKTKEPKIVGADVEKIEGRLGHIFDDGDISLQYTDPHTRQEFFWNLTVNDLVARLEVQKTDDKGVGFGLDADSLVEYLETKVANRINVDAKDAKFEMGEGGKVIEFQGSRPGIELLVDETYQMINDAFLQRTWHDEGITRSIQVVTAQVEPNVKTGQVNDLGISEILGTGISDFSGSAYNRILNIKNAVEKLNGVLIKPDEEFSAIKYTLPYSLAGGYLPELVIKGDEVKPEIGGGLCQIGTTLFRMAMNSGMDITERRNHSLQVSYYSDPVNGNPGTDATLYDPQLDLKFLNDTGHYILLQTYMDEANSQLYFTLWGTSDGRKGYYSHPEVSQWIGYGETVEKETTDLAPGERKCQTAYRGANASFTYTRELPDGEKIDRVFTSHYRPLPQICLVGAEEKVECEEGDAACEEISEDSEEAVEE